MLSTSPYAHCSCKLTFLPCHVIYHMAKQRAAISIRIFRFWRDVNFCTILAIIIRIMLEFLNIHVVTFVEPIHVYYAPLFRYYAQLCSSQIEERAIMLKLILCRYDMLRSIAAPWSWPDPHLAARIHSLPAQLLTNAQCTGLLECSMHSSSALWDHKQ